jgi:ATP-dependent DNA helicase RecQ
LDPEAEARLLSFVGVSPSELEDPLTPGELVSRLKQPPTATEVEQARWEAPDLQVDGSLSFDSEEERLFLQDWVAAELGPTAARWFIPQAPLDCIAPDQDGDAGARRVDFLISPPWQAPFVVEIDGEQHDSAAEVDADRDASLVGAGVDVIRIPAEEVRAGQGPGLDSVRARWEGPPKQPESRAWRLAWGAALTHRAVLGLLTGIESGLTGSSDRWVVEFSDPMNLIGETLQPYLT